MSKYISIQKWTWLLRMKPIQKQRQFALFSHALIEFKLSSLLTKLAANHFYACNENFVSIDTSGVLILWLFLPTNGRWVCVKCPLWLHEGNAHGNMKLFCYFKFGPSWWLCSMCYLPGDHLCPLVMIIQHDYLPGDHLLQTRLCTIIVTFIAVFCERLACISIF